MAQINWQWCKKCEGLFFAGNSLGVCPAGGNHDDSGSGGYALSDSGAGQSDWKWCNQCQGLFFVGNDLGVCPTHSDTASGKYVLPQSGGGQSGWKWCGKCQGLFFAVGGVGVCAAGGAHDDSKSGSYVLPQSGALILPGWRWCNKCQGLFLAESPESSSSGGTVFNNLGVCPAGGTHNDTMSGNYMLPQSGAGQSGWRWCNQCGGLFFAGNNLGVCPAPHSHTEAGSDTYVLPQSGVGQSGWKWCSKCQGLFFAVGGVGVCPSRVGQPTNQPGSHNGSAMGGYVLAPPPPLGQLNLAVTPTPSPMLQGRQATLLVIATDSQTGKVVNSLPVSAAKSYSASGNPVGPSSGGLTGTKFDYAPQQTDTTAAVYVRGAPAYEDSEETGIPVVAPPLPPPTVSYNFANHMLTGEWFPSSQCTVLITEGAGFINPGPFTGNIFTGIFFISPCSGNINETFTISVDCQGLPSPLSFTIGCMGH
jgi:hypothetical protein